LPNRPPHHIGHAHWMRDASIRLPRRKQAAWRMWMLGGNAPERISCAARLGGLFGRVE
jgi:hypothetical protein